MNKEWNLDILYSGFDDPKYSEDIKLLTKEIEALGALSSDISNMEEEKLVSEYIAISENLNLLASKLGILRTSSTRQIQKTPKRHRHSADLWVC